MLASQLAVEALSDRCLMNALTLGLAHNDYS